MNQLFPILRARSQERSLQLADFKNEKDNKRNREVEPFM